MAEQNEDSPLARLKKRLYASSGVDGVRETPLPRTVPRPPEHWQEELPVALPKKRISGSLVFLGFAVLFFALAGVVAATVLFLGGRSVSADRMEIHIEGPTTISGGEEVSFFINVRNGNPTIAENVVLEIDFPEGTFEAEDATKALQHVSESVGTLAAGETKRITKKAAFFGEENQRVTIPLRVEYRTGNSNATFVTDTSYGFVISTAPVTLSVNTLSEVNSGQPFTVVVKARSNAVSPLTNVGVVGTYGRGFIVNEETPVSDEKLFNLDTLAPGEGKEIRITGTMTGQEGEERTFTFAVGSLKAPDSREFGTPYSEKQTVVTIAKPFLTVGLSLNRSEDENIVIRSGDTVSSLVSWENALTSAILDGRIAVKFSGDALDSTSVDATNGFYRSADRTILFDPDTTRGLTRLEPGDSGDGSFSFTTKTGSAMNALRNPSITLSVSISGRRVGQGNVPESISSTLNKTIKIQTDLTLSARSVRTEGPFENSGPWPPVPEKETTYTVMLSAQNTVNTVANAVVKTTLPSYVRFTGLAEPTAGVKYNQTTREVTWTIGDMAPGAGKTAAFQVAVLPSVSQKGTSPKLTSEFKISGHDRFVEQEVGETAEAVSTETATDPDYEPTFGAVQ